MLKAILFDLDNTLILFDESRFYQEYFRRIETRFADLMPADIFRKRLISATHALLENNGEMINVEYFMNAFTEQSANQRHKLWNRFLNFYETEYDKIKMAIRLPNDLHETFHKIVRSGLKLVLASNPIFPLNIQMKRLAWAGLDHFHFDLVTHIENMSFCKPRIEYYLEICRKINELPQACLMVGNDPVNDMIAGSGGLKTYLTDDSKDSWRVTLDVSEDLLKDQILDIPEPDFKGPLSGVNLVIQQYAKEPSVIRSTDDMPSCKNKIN
jgi:FMN phosphatase YigB (HAD superfamily)